MSVIKKYDFSADIYDYDSNLIEIVDNKAKLKLINNVGQIVESFTSDAGFTYTADAEFSGGRLQLVDKMPANSKMWVPFTSSVDGTAGDGGDLTGTLVNGATIASGKLDLSTGALNNSKYARYDGVGKVRAARGAVKFKYTVQKATPDNDITFFEIGHVGDFDNQLFLVWQTTRAIRVTSRNVTGGVIQTNTPFGSWFPTVGQTYEICYNWDFTSGNGRHECFIDGLQQGTTQVQTGSRNNDLVASDYLGIGNPYWTNQIVDDFIIFDEPHKTAPYTPGYSIEDYRYKESYISSPTQDFDSSPDGVLQSIQNWTPTSQGNELFTLEDGSSNPYWFENGEWKISNKSYLEANTALEIKTNFAEFPFPSGPNLFGYGIVFPNSNTTQGYIDNLIIDYTHQLYPVSDPVISVQNHYRIWSEALEEFTDSATLPLNTAVQYQQVRQGSKIYWDGAAWSPATAGLWSNSNTQTDSNLNIDTVVPMGARLQIGFDMLLRSTDGKLTPLVDFVQYTYDAALIDIEPRLIDVNGFLRNNCCPPVGLVVSVRPYLHGVANPIQGCFNIYEFQTMGTANSDGYFSGSVMLLPDGEFWEFEIGDQSYYAPVDDVDAVDFSTLDLKVVE